MLMVEEARETEVAGCTFYHRQVNASVVGLPPRLLRLRLNNPLHLGPLHQSSVPDKLPRKHSIVSIN